MGGVADRDSSGSVAVRFRFRPYERILFTLLLSTACQVFTFVGAVLATVSFLPVAGEFQWLLLWIGILGLSSCVWQPYTTKLKAVERSYRATIDGFEWDIEDSGTGRTGWQAFRGARHFAGALLLKQQVNCPPITIPLRAFGAEQLATFEGLLYGGIASGAASGAVVPSGSGEPLFSFQTQPPSFWKYVRIRATEVGVATTFLLAGGCLVVGFLFAIGGSPEAGISFGALAVFVAFAPWVIALLVTARGRRALRPVDIYVYQAGYHVAGDFESWTPWSTFKRGREERDALVLFVGRSRGHVHLWTTGLPEAQRAVLRSLVSQAQVVFAPRA